MNTYTKSTLEALIAEHGALGEELALVAKIDAIDVKALREVASRLTSVANAIMSATYRA